MQPPEASPDPELDSIVVAEDALGHLLALKVTAANEQDRDQVGELAQAVQHVIGQHVELALCGRGLHG